MKQVFKAILLLPLLISFGIGNEYGFDDHPDIPAAVERFKQTDAVVFRLHCMTDRTPQQEQELAQAREERVRLADDIMNCGFPSVAAGLSYPMYRALRMQRLDAYFRMHDAFFKMHSNLSQS